MISLHNIQDQETVYQRCLLVTGRCDQVSDNDGHVEVVMEDEYGRRETFPSQRWPLSHGHFKALVILSPGTNKMRITSGHDSSDTIAISVKYVPLLQTPPLHLAIMVAKDSPLLIDCPPSKFGFLSGAHANLDAAIAKFRLTAYMWQALTAEEMNLNGFDRRTFRLEEEWAPDTMSLNFANDATMQSTAKVHLIRSDKTVAELRNAQFAQQNASASRADRLHEIFTEALLAHGAPFTTEARPVVAGMILDSHYDAASKLIVAHAALGSHNVNGLSLGIFGSHLTYSWPRSMEEVPDCLLDVTQPGDRVGNDNGECASMWEACAVGQGAFLHEVGHAFSAPHTTGIMARGYSKDWPKCFLSKTARSVQHGSPGASPVTDKTPNDCHWDVRDMLRFRNLAHFQWPSDVSLSSEVPKFDVHHDEQFLRITVTSESGIAWAAFNGAVEDSLSVARPLKSLQFTVDELEDRFNREQPLELEVVGMNGKQRSANVWTLCSKVNFIRVRGTALTLKKSGVSADSTQSEPDTWPWVVMLKKRGHDGSLYSASKIDIRVGCALDGAIVYYKDGTTIPCGPRGNNGEDHGMGGHQAKKIAIPRGVEISKVAISKYGRSSSLAGMRIGLSNGQAMGALNKRQGCSVETLVPEVNHKIVGFYGTSGQYGMCTEFGILQAPTDQSLPDSVYDQPELQNPPKGGRQTANKRKRDSQSDTEDETDVSQDWDGGYDDDLSGEDF